MKRHPNFKADLVVFGLYVFLLGSVFSIFVLEKDSDARLGLFAASVWLLIVLGALYIRLKRKQSDKINERSEDS